MNELTSLDYCKLIAWLAYHKYNVILNKTQMQKILFMCYGQYLASHNSPLFNDDIPKAWPFGPVFPRSYKRYSDGVPKDLTVSEKERFLKDKDTLRMITRTVDDYHTCSSTSLSEWSHKKGSPWEVTVFSNGKEKIAWNKVIDNSIISDFFNNDEWRNIF